MTTAIWAGVVEIVSTYCGVNINLMLRVTGNGAS